MPLDELASRLTALEDRAPGDIDPPTLRPRSRRRALAPLLLAGVLIPVTVASVAAGAALLAQGYPGVENKGQPLHGAQLECMSPPAAAAYLARRGFDDVIWQVESGRSKDGTSVQQRTPPQHGYVVPGAVLPGGTLMMVIDQRDGATGTGDCFDMRMP